MMFHTVLHIIRLEYHNQGNFGRAIVWLIWQIDTNSPTFILFSYTNNDLLVKFTKLSSAKLIHLLICETLFLPKFCQLHYVVAYKIPPYSIA